ncbi:MAG: homocysteine S-methyltransferase family protein [Candidatus Tectomicrobia bacterium]|uniref:Methionine synthase n=1 Tax=Tectimicrobiota bacterium TaxID=2528274 RepID=A0A933GKJ7_UNCTE|nr:homocysteine S-methyltransferase family protein [Candidatus Tectomicrobia bacterium]
MNKLENLLHKGIVLLDGAMGTMLQQASRASISCLEEYNLSKPKLVQEVHKAYLAAGSEILLTNTLGANRLKLAEYSLQDRVTEINREGVKLAKEAAGDKALVAASIGPTGKFLAPLGHLTFDAAVRAFSEHVGCVSQSGADLILIETISDLREMKAAIIAAREVCDLPILATMTFQENGKTIMDAEALCCCLVMQSLGVAAVGANCSLGPEGLLDILVKMRDVSQKPLLIQPNAGLPQLKDGRTIFPATPEIFASYAEKFRLEGISLLGGCCGTTPEHIKAMARVIKGKKIVRFLPKYTGSLVCSRNEVVGIGGKNPPVVIGERLNPTGRRDLAAQMREGRFDLFRREALAQVEHGARVLDVNVGIPGIDEVRAIDQAVTAVQSVTRVPVMLDTNNPLVLEAGLKAAEGRVIINSVNGEKGSLERILPLAKKYGALLIGLTLDEKGIPTSGKGRFKIAEGILKAVVEAGLPTYSLIIDPLTLAVSAEPNQALESLEAVSLIKKKLGLATVLGVSNVSFGLPRRELINYSFLAMALGNGLDAAILNPFSQITMDICTSVTLLRGQDPGAQRYIERCQGEKIPPAVFPRAVEREMADVGEQLYKAVLEGDETSIVLLVEKALEQGMNPVEINKLYMIPAITRVGELFQDGEYFLPQLIRAGHTMEIGISRLKKEERPFQGERKGKILFATAHGDIHDIGKNIVITQLENFGFEVIDLGKSVPLEKITREAKERQVDIIGLSALMTNTMQEMEKLVKKCREEGLGSLVMVGGAVVTKEYADRIGADGYAEDAVKAVALADQLMVRRARSRA